MVNSVYYIIENKKRKSCQIVIKSELWIRFYQIVSKLSRNPNRWIRWPEDRNEGNNALNWIHAGCKGAVICPTLTHSGLKVGYIVVVWIVNRGDKEWREEIVVRVTTTKLASGISFRWREIFLPIQYLFFISILSSEIDFYSNVN